jgi:hypothetical protein
MWVIMGGVCSVVMLETDALVTHNNNNNKVIEVSSKTILHRAYHGITTTKSNLTPHSECYSHRPE